MRDAEQAAHVIGKLLKYVGEDRVLWGTDSIWYGSPQDQIMAFRAFQISDEFHQKFGYPKLTPQIRAKIFGLNGAAAYGLTPTEVRKSTARDPLGRARVAYREAPDPSFLTYGPKNRREFFRLLAVICPDPDTGRPSNARIDLAGVGADARCDLQAFAGSTALSQTATPTRGEANVRGIAAWMSAVY